MCTTAATRLYAVVKGSRSNVYVKTVRAAPDVVTLSVRLLVVLQKTPLPDSTSLMWLYDLAKSTTRLYSQLMILHGVSMEGPTLMRLRFITRVEMIYRLSAKESRWLRLSDQQCDVGVGLLREYYQSFLSDECRPS
ncbi:hypothetical protein TNCV_4023531 [Trichonephila clavipes]|nr:hypothetical protein TNCV_4023531 [Trichonephila clavipes]